MLGQARKEREKKEEGRVYYFEGRKLVYGPLGHPVVGNVELIEEFKILFEQPYSAHVMVYRAWINEDTPVFIVTLWFENLITGSKTKEEVWGLSENGTTEALENAAEKWKKEKPNAEINPFLEALKGNGTLIDYLGHPHPS